MPIKNKKKIYSSYTPTADEKKIRSMQQQIKELQKVVEGLTAKAEEDTTEDPVVAGAKRKKKG